jgi:hypothetical protein
MISRFVISLSIATVLAIPAVSRAGDTRWALLRAYQLAEGHVVALAVPAEWQELGTQRTPGAAFALRFADESGTRFEIQLATLAHASAIKPTVWEDVKKYHLGVMRAIATPAPREEKRLEAHAEVGRARTSLDARALAEEEYKFVTAGAFPKGGVVLAYAILTNRRQAAGDRAVDGNAEERALVP